MLIKKQAHHLVGFTLIELLVAITVFLIGIMGAFSLSLHNLNTARENYYRVVAADLAREGIELVRNVRDSNWLARDANIDNPDTIAVDVYDWDHGFVAKNFLVDYDTSGFISLSPTEPVDLSAAIADPRSRLYLNNGFYNHDSSGSGTVFHRAIGLQAICLDDSNPLAPVESLAPSLDCVALQKIGFQVIARVQYTYGGRTSSIDALEKIYNWRP